MFELGTFVPDNSQYVEAILGNVIDYETDVPAFLSNRQTDLIEAAREAVERSHLDHYEAAGLETVDRRLMKLFDVLVACCREHHLDEAVSYAESLAAERQSGGYSLLEVQTVINVLEETVWRAVMGGMPVEEQGYALALVSTVLGSVKDAVARSYLSGLGSRPIPLRLESLFGGTEGSARES